MAVNPLNNIFNTAGGIEQVETTQSYEYLIQQLFGPNYGGGLPSLHGGYDPVIYAQRMSKYLKDNGITLDELKDEEGNILEGPNRDLAVDFLTIVASGLFGDPGPDSIPDWNEWYAANGPDTSGGDAGLGELDPNADIRQILKDNGYSDEAIEEIFKAEINSEKFKGNNVLSNALCEIGYSNCSDWSVNANNSAGDECQNDDGMGTYQNGECVTDTSEGTPCWTYTSKTGRVEGKRDANGQCIPFGSYGGDDNTDCVVITQENADECGYEITSDGQLVPIDLGDDPNSYPTYVDCGGGIFAETEEDCPEIEGTGDTPEDQALADLIEEIGQETYDEAVGVLDKIKGEVGAVVNDPVGAIRDIANNILTASTGVSVTDECRATGGPDWIKNCVTFGGILSIPGLEIPAAILGGVFSGVTIQDMEDVLVEAGKKWEDIKNGVPTCGENNDEACTPENILGDIGDWVVGKVTDVFADVKDGVGSITVEGVLKKIGEFLPPAVAAVVYGEFKDEINTAIGVPVFLTTAEECASKDTIEDPDNPGSCLPIAVVEEEGTFDCASINQKGGIVNSAEDCDGCLDGYQASANGCVATPVICKDNEEYNEATNKCEPVVSFTEGAPCNTSEGSGKYNAEGECVVDDVTSDGTVDDTVDDPIAILCSNPRPTEYGFEQINWDKLCGEVTTVTTGGDVEPEECPEGQTRNAEGQCEDNPIVTPAGSPCAQQNRVENEDGSCGECLPGYMIDPKGFDQCVTTGIPVTGGPEPEPEPEAPSGGGGVGGGGGGMFEPASLELSYNRTPELVVSNKPFVDYSAQLDAQVARLLTNRKDIV